MPSPTTQSCPRCGKAFTAPNALYQHMKTKYGRKAASPFYVAPEREQSLAEELVAAEIAFKTDGVQPPSYLLSMFPDSFKGGRHVG